MYHILKKYFSVLFLILFVVPQAEITIHHYSHLGEKHCDIKSTHFHSPEEDHVCQECDYLLPVLTLETVASECLAVQTLILENFTAKLSQLYFSELYFDPQRGPPVI